MSGVEPGSIFVFAVAVAAGWTAWRQWLILRVGARSERFASTQGRIIRSQVVREAFAMGETEEIQAPGITYAYEVGGRRYEGTRVSFEPIVSTIFAARAQRICARYPLDAHVQVYYDPDDPEQACLETVARVSAVAWLQVLAPLVIAIGAAGWLILG